MQSSKSWARVLFAVLFIVVTWLTLTPDPNDTRAGLAVTRWIASLLFGDASLGDKVAHFSAYGTLGAAAFLAQFSMFGRKRWIPLYLAAYGALLEGVQGIGGIRSPEIWDAVCNAAGAIAGYGGMFMLIRLLSLRKA